MAGECKAQARGGIDLRSAKTPRIAKKTGFFGGRRRKTLVLQGRVIYTCAQVAIGALYEVSF
jgi:hypothetical protein